MRTTVDIPDELFRRAKSEAALRGRKLKDLVEEGLRLVLEKEPAPTIVEKKPAVKPRPGSLHARPSGACERRWTIEGKAYFDRLHMDIDT